MSSFPCLVRFVSGSGEVRCRLGNRLVERYLEFVELAVARRHRRCGLGRQLHDALLAGSAGSAC